MKILLTNDDGIHGEGLRLLARFCADFAEVTVVAPKYEQSGRSHGIVIHNAYEIVKSDVFADLGITAYSVDASPADCVRYAVAGLHGEYDFVFSGLNNGYNLGHDVAYSGTCGAAFEGNYAGIRAVSFSTAKGNLKEAAKYLKTAFDYICDNGLFSHCSMYNVNIPEGHVRGIGITEQGSTFYRDHFVEVEENMFEAQCYLTKDPQGDLDIRYDTDAVLSGYCSITPLLTNRTDMNAIKALNK